MSFTGSDRGMVIDPDAVREARIQRTLTKRELARLAGVHYKTIEYIECGRLGASDVMIHKIAVALGVDDRRKIMRPKPKKPNGRAA